MLVYTLALMRIFHEILNATFLSLNCLRYLLKSVSLHLFLFLNDIWWFCHLVLNSVAVRPTYIIHLSFFLGSNSGLVNILLLAATHLIEC